MQCGDYSHAGLWCCRAHQLLVYTVISCSLLFLLYHTLSGGPTRTSPASSYRTCPNTTYPGYRRQLGRATRLKLAVIADLDTASRLPGQDKWVSYMKSGYLDLDNNLAAVTIDMEEEETRLASNVAAGGRGMELSELSVFNGRLLSLDDRTGIVYSVAGDRVLPWLILPDGDGLTSSKGFKAEWSTVVGDKLVVGGLGKEWTTQTGDILNHDPMWVKEVSCEGAVRHLDWRHRYLAVREVAGISWPGYMIHEAVCWSSVRSQWVFLPRRMSKDKYDDVTDEKMGANTMITASEDFSDIRMVTVGKKIPTHGFSSCKFIPGTEDNLIVALKSEEIEGRVATYIMVFNIEGKVLLDEVKIGDRKFEGVEFL